MNANDQTNMVSKNLLIAAIVISFVLGVVVGNVVFTNDTPVVDDHHQNETEVMEEAHQENDQDTSPLNEATDPLDGSEEPFDNSSEGGQKFDLAP